MRLNEEQQKEFYALIDELKKGIVIIEGKKDKEALQMFGITNIIELYKVKQEFSKNEHKFRDKEVIILTDVDKKGNQLCKELLNFLFNNGIYNVNVLIRKKLSYLLKINQFEGLRKRIDLYKVRKWEKHI